MEQFNKWWLIDHNHFGPIPKDCAKSAWKAALDWVYSLREPDHTDIFEVINPLWIEKELEKKLNGGQK